MNSNIYKFTQRQSGFTLAELMIAMTVGLILVGGIIQVFAATTRTNRVHEDTSRMQESGRMALEIIGRDIRMADFWGCVSQVSSVVNNLDAAGAGYIDFGGGGVNGTEGGAGVPDTLTLRGAFNAGIAVEPPYGPQPSANVKVTANNPLQQADIVLISDCSTADIFQITNANPGDAGVLVHNTGATTSPGNFNVTNPGCPGANAHCLSKVYGADASVFLSGQITYNVANGAQGHPALFRNGQEFLDGIEDFQVLYGEDTSGDGTANYYVTANQVTDMEQIVSLRISVVTRSYNTSLTDGLDQNYSVLGDARTGTDGRLRQVYTSTVAVRNRLQ